ncbi:hypothetical protein F5Y12DRAFT_390231 [Xylaria sp. FL1777]|nr:hypothetical protein F5Y12DRAFT_390231 [Xylaria sp. FL1777]
MKLRRRARAVANLTSRFRRSECQFPLGYRRTGNKRTRAPTISRWRWRWSGSAAARCSLPLLSLTTGKRTGRRSFRNGTPSAMMCVFRRICLGPRNTPEHRWQCCRVWLAGAPLSVGRHRNFEDANKLRAGMWNLCARSRTFVWPVALARQLLIGRARDSVAGLACQGPIGLHVLRR